MSRAIAVTALLGKGPPVVRGSSIEHLWATNFTYQIDLI